MSQNQKIVRVRKQILHNDEYSIVHKESAANLIQTSDGRDVQINLDEILDWISNYSGSPSGGNSDFRFVFFNSAAEFPSLGLRSTIYIAEGGGFEGIYIWDNVGMRYRKVADYAMNIKVIDGGSAVIN